MSLTPAASRRSLLAAGLGLAVAPSAVAASAGKEAPRAPGAADFDFLLGAWTVRHRRLKHRLAGRTDWVEFPGTLDVRGILAGQGDVDQNVLDDPAGRYLATSLRIFNAAAGAWSIYWIDARAPGLDPPVVGRFEGRLGRFYNDDTLAGRPIRVRFTYEDLGPGRAQWTQAFSPDKGASWETNWTMDFTRAAPV
ncbi:MAG TPA: DUF1579 domain-containing protein [Phenylobacterium sp.]|jgi:hypothetical protein